MPSPKTPESPEQLAKKVASLKRAVTQMTKRIETLEVTFNTFHDNVRTILEEMVKNFRGLAEDMVVILNMMEEHGGFTADCAWRKRGEELLTQDEKEKQDREEREKLVKRLKAELSKLSDKVIDLNLALKKKKKLPPADAE